MINSMLEFRVRLRDALGLGYPDRGARSAIAECLDWLARAQDFSASHDGGVARIQRVVPPWRTG